MNKNKYTARFLSTLGQVKNPGFNCGEFATIAQELTGQFHHAWHPLKFAQHSRHASTSVSATLAAFLFLAAYSTDAP
jgi:hypothetical protein